MLGKTPIGVEWDLPTVRPHKKINVHGVDHKVDPMLNIGQP